MMDNLFSRLLSLATLVSLLMLMPVNANVGSFSSQQNYLTANSSESMQLSSSVFYGTYNLQNFSAFATGQKMYSQTNLSSWVNLAEALEDCGLNCPDDITVGAVPGGNSAIVNYSSPMIGDCAPTPFSMTQNVGTPINNSSGVDCQAGGEAPSPGGVMRAYTNNTGTSISIESVEIGGSTYTGVDIRINIYSYTGPLGQATLSLGDMTLIGQSPIVSTQLGGFQTIGMGTPVVIADGESFVVEQWRGPGQAFLFGFQENGGQTAPSYIYSYGDCGIADPSSFAAIGFPQMSLLQKVNGILLDASSDFNLVQTSGLPSGSAFPIGTTTNCFQLQDGDGNVIDECCFDVIVNEIVAPPCTPSFTNSVEPITSVVFSDIDHQSPVSGAPAYENFTTIVGNVTAGSSYDITVKGFTDGDWINYFTVFFNWDNANNWSGAQMVEIGSIENSSGFDTEEATASVLIPANIAPGTYTMRVVKNFGASPTSACGSYGWGQAEDYTLNVVQSGNVCTGAEVGDLIGEQNREICMGHQFTLAVDGVSELAYGLTLKWQWSPSNQDSWTDIPNSSSASKTFTMDGDKDYRLVVICEVGDDYEEAISDVFHITQNHDYANCYCTPVSNNPDLFIDAFLAQGGGDNMIENYVDSFGDDGYLDFTDMEVDTWAGDTVLVAARGSQSFGIPWMAYRIWVDWNEDGTFTPDEVVWYDDDFLIANAAGSFDVPATVAPGKYRLRIVTEYLGDDGNVDPCIIGYSDGNFHDYTVNVIDYVECAEVDAGVPAAEEMMICLGASFGVEVLGASGPAIGLERTWQVSWDGGENWDDLDIPSPSVGLIGSGFEEAHLRYYVHCTLSGEEDFSNVIHVYINPNPEECLCVPADIFEVDSITNVEFSNISNYQDPDSGYPYEDFTNFIGVVKPGETYQFKGQGDTGGNFTSYFTVYFDWNNDLTFDASERYEIGSITNSDGYDNKAATANITIPNDAVMDEPIRMRVMMSYNEYSEDSCNIGTGFGQTEDYYVYITEAEGCDNISAGEKVGIDELICPMTPFTLSVTGASDLSADIIRTWQYFDEASQEWIDIPGTNSTSMEVSGITDDTKYRFYVGCATDPGQFEVSDVFEMTINTAPLACLCSPFTTSPSAAINGFSATGDPTPLGGSSINNSNTGYGNNGYTDYRSTQTVDVEEDGVIDFTVNLINGRGGVRIWVDWDKSGTFDGNESVFNTSSYAFNHTGSFQVPAGMAGSTYTMRVGSSNVDTKGANNPCGHPFGGEYEDYTINVAAPLPDCEAELVVTIIDIMTFQEVECLEEGIPYLMGIVVTGGQPTYKYSIEEPNTGLQVDLFENEPLLINAEFYAGDEYSFSFVGIDNPNCNGIVAGVLETCDAPEPECDIDLEFSLPECVDSSTYYVTATITGTASEGVTFTVIGSGITWAVDAEVGDEITLIYDAGEGGTVYVSANNADCSVEKSFVAPDPCPEPEPECDIDLEFSLPECVDSGTYYVTATITGTASEGVTFTVIGSGITWAVDAEVGDEITLIYDAGEDGTVYVTANNADCSAEKSFVAPDSCDEPEPGEICDWRIRVWGNNGMGVEWTLTDGNGNVVDSSPDGGWASNSISYLSGTYQLVEPVTFNLKANTTGDYQSVNYYLLRNGAKIEHGRVRDQEATFVRYCSDDAEAKSGMTASMSDFDFTYHPNPVKDVLYINSVKDVKEVKVYNMTGQQMLNFDKGLSVKNELDVTKLPSGVYIFRAVLEDGQVETFKVVKK